MAAPRRPNPDRIVDAALALAARASWRDVTLGAIAAEAKISPSQLHATFRSKSAILDALGDRVDAAMLQGVDDEQAGEPAHDRLLDAVLRRFEALAGHRPAMASILRDTVADPMAALCSLPRLLRSMAWTLEAAGIGSAGLAGRIRTKGLAAIYVSAFAVWLRDDSPDLGRTMAYLDRSLRRAERLSMALCRGPSRREAEAEEG